MQFLLSSIDNDKGFLKIIIKQFNKQIPKKISELKEAIDKKDAPAAAGLAHQLKGSIGYFNNKELLNLILKIEQMCKNNNISKAAAVFLKVEKMVSNIIKYLNDLDINNL